MTNQVTSRLSYLPEPLASVDIDALALAKDQQDKIKAISNEYKAKKKEMLTSAGFDVRPAMQITIQALNKVRDARINDVLTNQVFCFHHAEI